LEQAGQEPQQQEHKVLLAVILYSALLHQMVAVAVVRLIFQITAVTAVLVEVLVVVVVPAAQELVAQEIRLTLLRPKAIMGAMVLPYPAHKETVAVEVEQQTRAGTLRVVLLLVMVALEPPHPLPDYQ